MSVSAKRSLLIHPRLVPHEDEIGLKLESACGQMRRMKGQEDSNSRPGAITLLRIPYGTRFVGKLLHHVVHGCLGATVRISRQRNTIVARDANTGRDDLAAPLRPSFALVRGI